MTGPVSSLSRTARGPRGLLPALPLIIALLVPLLAGCAALGRGELVRIQGQRNAANKYASGGWMERRDAVREIAGYFGKDKNDLVIGTLLVGANDPSAAVRMEAVQALARIRTDAALAAIRKLALHETEGNVRWYALQALRSAGDPLSADVFIRGSMSDDWLIREESVKGMLSLDDATIRARCVPAIIRSMNDSSSSVALTALRRVRTSDPRLYRAIAERFNACGMFDYSLLEASLTALEGYRLDAKTKEKVINLLVHHNTAIRLLALRVLKKDRAPTAREQ